MPGPTSTVPTSLPEPPAVVPRYALPGCLVPERGFTVENCRRYAGCIKLDDQVIPNKGKPDKINVYLDDGLPGRRKVTGRFIKVMSQYGIGSNEMKSNAEAGQGGNAPQAAPSSNGGGGGGANGANGGRAETFSLQLHTRDNAPEFEDMGRHLEDVFTGLMHAKAPQWAKKQLSEETVREKMNMIIRSPKSEVSAAKYGPSWKLDIYPECKNLMANWLRCAFEDLYDRAERRGRSGLYYVDWEITHIWILNGNWGVKFNITGLNFEAVAEEDNSLLADAIQNGWAQPAPALAAAAAAAAAAGTTSNRTAAPPKPDDMEDGPGGPCHTNVVYETGPEHDILTPAPKVGGAKRGRDEDSGDANGHIATTTTGSPRTKHLKADEPAEVPPPTEVV